jgi:hypothetical protein
MSGMARRVSSPSPHPGVGCGRDHGGDVPVLHWSSEACRLIFLCVRRRFCCLAPFMRAHVSNSVTTPHRPRVRSEHDNDAGCEKPALDVSSAPTPAPGPRTCGELCAAAPIRATRIPKDFRYLITGTCGRLALNSLAGKSTDPSNNASRQDRHCHISTVSHGAKQVKRPAPHLDRDHFR